MRDLWSGSDRRRAARGHRARDARSHDGRDDPSRPQRPRHLPGRRRRLRRAPPQHRRRRGGAPAVRQRDRRRLGHAERRALQPRGDPRAISSRTGTSSTRAATPRSCRTSTSATARTIAEQLRGKFGIAVWDGRRRRAVVARDRLGVKPLYWAQAGDLVVFASELKSLLASGLVGMRARLRGDRRLPHASASSRARARRSRACSKLLPGHRLVIDEGGVAVERYWSYPRPDGAGRPDARRVGRGADRAARGRRQVAADERRAARRDAQRRPRLERDRRADGAQHGRAGQDLLRRLRRGRRQERARPTRGSSRTRSAPTTTSSSCRSPTPTVDLDAALLADRRAARRPLLARLRRALRARRAPRHRRAVRPGRRRAARRLRQAPGRRRGRRVPARPAARSARWRWPPAGAGPPARGASPTRWRRPARSSGCWR